MAIDDFLGRLEGVMGKAPRWRARCPAHKSRSRSLSIAEAEGGRILVHCFAGCSVVEVVGAVGVSLSDLMPPGRPETALGRVRRPWGYSEIADNLQRELTVVWLILGDVLALPGVPGELRERLGLARERCIGAIHELAR